MIANAFRASAPMAVLALAACQPPGTGALTAADIQAIRTTTETFVAAARRGDWSTVAMTYTPDAILLPPDAPAVEGPDKIREFFESFPPITAFSVEDLEISGAGDLAYVRGSYSLTLAPPDLGSLVENGKFLEIRRKQPDGSWLLSRDMFSADAPAQTAR